MYKILVADDEKEIVRLLQLYLEKDGIEVIEAYDGLMASGIIKQEQIDLALIDIMMPKMNGFELIKEIRKNSNIPILVLSAKVQSADKILGLELGADDYITKPFDGVEVAARVRAALRRYHQLGSRKLHVQEQIVVGELMLDIHECIIFKRNEKIDLTAVELRILTLLMRSPGRVFTKEQIYEAAWEGNAVDDNTIRVAMSKVRDKIGAEKIKTIRGLGYRLEKVYE